MKIRGTTFLINVIDVSEQHSRDFNRSDLDNANSDGSF